ncbi:MAG TPA: LbtU family siderophore porin [Tichowtungia sp.]|nr:LbtU family siderophore porin [Tichowtungia sp.]
MKKTEWMLIGGVLATGVFAEESTLPARATEQRLELHGHQHSVAGNLPKQNELDSILDGLEYGALFEWEIGHSDGQTDETMATVELGAGWQVTDWLHGDVVFLYEEGGTDPMDLDQLYITLGNTDEFPLIFQAGQFYVPFGHLDSFFISDPIVLELAEGLEKGATLGFEDGGFSASLTVFESEISGANDYNGVLAASYSTESDDSSIAVGAALIHNILDADGLTGALEDEGCFSAEEAAGFNAWLTATRGKITLIAEYVQTLQDLEVDGNDAGLKPASLNLEMGVELTELIGVAAKYEKAQDAEDWFAETRYGLVGSCTVFERDWVAAGVALEYLREEFADETESDLFTLQLALEF